MVRRGRGRSDLDPTVRAGRFDNKPEVFSPQSGEVSATIGTEVLMFVAALDTLIKSMTLDISQSNPAPETPQTEVYIKFIFPEGLEIKFPTRDISDGLNSYLIPRALARLEQGTKVYLHISKTMPVIYSFDMRI